MFTIITGNEIVVDIHIARDFTKANEGIKNTCFLGGAHAFNAFAMADSIKQEGLDGRVVMLGTISIDRFGRNFRDIAKMRGVDTSLAPDTDADTLIALVQRSQHNNSFHFPNQSRNAITVTRAKHLPSLPDENKMMVMQGLCSTVKPSGDVWYDYAIRNQDMMVVYDANIRMPAIKDVEAHKVLLAKWAARAQVMKVSDADIESIYGGDADYSVVCSGYLDAGASAVCLTKGGKSVVTYTPHHRVVNDVKPMEVSNTVGAGDNFTAGLMLGFVRAGMFDAESIASAGKGQLHKIAQSGIDRAARHLRLINP